MLFRDKKYYSISNEHRATLWYHLSIKSFGIMKKGNGRISDRAEIQAPNFQLQYLLQLYSKNLTIMAIHRNPVNGSMLIFGFYG